MDEIKWKVYLRQLFYSFSTEKVIYPCSKVSFSFEIMCWFFLARPARHTWLIVDLWVLSVVPRVSSYWNKTPLCRCYCYGNCEKNPKSVLLCGDNATSSENIQHLYCPWLWSYHTVCGNNGSAPYWAAIIQNQLSFFPVILFLWLLIPPLKMTGRI